MALKADILVLSGRSRTFDVLFLIFICSLFVAFKFNHLQLPYFWDEAWSYIPAIKTMQEAGPSLLPNSIDPELYKGHPLFFYFAASLWLNIFGDSIFVSRLFPMAISLCLIVSIYRLSKSFFGPIVAISSTMIFSIQSVFLAQSSFMLPEVLLSLLTVLTFHAYLSKNQGMTCIWLCLAVLTKESAGVLWLTLLLAALINYLMLKERKSIFREFWIFVVPAVLAILFFVLQKLHTGWFFYPEHIDYLNFGDFGKTLWLRCKYFIWDMGGSLLTIVGLLFALYLMFVQKIRWSSHISHILLFTTFILLYLIYSSVNFYTPRYVLSILPYGIIIPVFFIETAFKRKKRVSISLLLSIFLFNVFFTFTRTGGNDHNLGFIDVVLCHQEAVRFCEKQNYRDKYIVTHFLMEQNLENKDLGYLENTAFTNVSSFRYDPMDIAIISSVELKPKFSEEIKKRNGKLVKRFEWGKEWSEIYEF